MASIGTASSIRGVKKEIIALVVGLISISILGLVGLQLYWINLSYKVAEEQFDLTVHEALAQVVDKPFDSKILLCKIKPF